MRAAVSTLLVGLLVPWSAFGQSIGANVAGRITDPSGARLPDASITITNVLTGRAETTAAGPAGDYRMVALAPGDYEVLAARDRFVPATRRVTLLVGAEATVNFTLSVAGPELRAAAVVETPLVEVARSQPSSAVTQDEIDALPVIDRNFLALAQLLPGSGPVNSTVGRFAISKFGGPADQRSGYTTRVDGGDIDDAQWGGPTINVGQDAVQEFRVFRYQFDAEYGHALNAVVTVVTRSGTNQYSGRGFYFGRDEALNARNPLATVNPPFDEQRAGGSVGGPLSRDRSHFFGAYERDNVDSVRIIALPPANPLAASENGVFPAEADNQTAAARVDLRLGGGHALSVRYGYDNQQLLRALSGITSDSSQVDVFNRSHRLVLEDTWAPERNVAHALRLHVLHHTLSTVPRTSTVGVIRPSGTVGQTNADSQTLPRIRLAVADTVYLHRPRHDAKFGVELAVASHDNDSHVLENGVFRFQTDLPFDPNNAQTWPRSLDQQVPSVVTYRSREFGLFVQDDWHVGSRVRMNAGLRYDIDLGMRLNSFYSRLLADPSLTGIDRFVSGRRGTDTNNIQPRLGATWDVRGDGRTVVRGGWGVYVARNRPWFQLRSMNQFVSNPLRVTDRNCLRLFPDVRAVLGPPLPDGTFACQDARQLGTVIPDDFVQPYALNSTLGLGWQLTARSAIDVDYVHSPATRQTGVTDRNLPVSGAIGTTNPRPAPQFGQLLMLENYSDSWYDALETQFRLRAGTGQSLHVSYALSRSYLDGVDFFLTTRGTQRSPHERGYNPSDQRHNLALAGTMRLPGSLDVAAIVRLASGSPMKVQAGFDIDGDTIITGDLPREIPITVGRERADESLSAINQLRASLGLAPIGRGLLDLDPFRSVDVRITRTVSLARRRLELLIECFNLTNHTNFRSPVGSPPNAGSNINSNAFLQRTVARDARQIQWGARYTF